MAGHGRAGRDCSAAWVRKSGDEEVQLHDQRGVFGKESVRAVSAEGYMARNK